MRKKIAIAVVFIALISLAFRADYFIEHITLNNFGHRQSLQLETQNKPLKICVISDLNSSYGSTSYNSDVKAVINELSTIKPDIILCAGDMVAGQKASLTEQNIENMWAAFKSTVLNPIDSLKIPFGFTVGNHDASPNYKTDRALAKKFWTENVSATRLTFVDSTHYPFYFSYIKNNVFFLSWDASSAKIQPEVFNWMKAQLAGKIARKARLRILLGHLPLYAIVESKNKPGEVLAAADSTLKLIKSNKIDLYISGHQHAYYPAAKNGIRLLNTGAIGDGPRQLIGHNEAPKKSYTIIEIPANRNKSFIYKTFMPQTNLPIETNSLPESIKGFNGISKREDL